MKNSNYSQPFGNSKGTNRLLYVILFISVLSSCTVSRQIGKQANAILLQDTIIGTGHVGISIFEPASNTYLYNYNADKYFIPASNVKLFTLYAGMKYLGDSLVGIKYQHFNDSFINILPTGDPTFLHPDFPNQPVLDFLQLQQKAIYVANPFQHSALGKGWAWDDYNEGYMAERNAMPVYGNVAVFKLKDIKFDSAYAGKLNWDIQPRYIKDYVVANRVLPLSIRIKREMQDTGLCKKKLFDFTIVRDRTRNDFTLSEAAAAFTDQKIPFCTDGVKTAKQVLKYDFHVNIKEGWQPDDALYTGIPPHLQWHVVKSQPTDSLFKPMMYNSDNFFAEQTLLMASNEHLGDMNDETIIDTLLKYDCKDIPQQPRWVDGSGLSRYNLFTPQSFIYILTKLKNEFGWERLKVILPTGGQGSLKNYYHSDSGFIYAKTGSMSNQVALSGYLITKKNKFLIFSVLVNNCKGRATTVKRAVEQFIKAVLGKY